MLFARHVQPEDEQRLIIPVFSQQDILERELSMAVLKDSKRWEKKYRSKVCGLLRKYGDYESLFLGLTDDRDKEDKRETERILLAEHQIYPNPSYVYFKGNAEFYFSNGLCVRTDPSMPMAFSSAALKGLKALYIGIIGTIVREYLFRRDLKADGRSGELGSVL